MPYYPTRKLTILAFDPGIRDAKGNILRTQLEIPNEFLEAGPRGYRVHVIDYDSHNDVLYSPAPVTAAMNQSSSAPEDPFAKQKDTALLNDPGFHAFMTYAIVMKTLARFEFALGRRISWSYGGPQLQLAPHAFADANAFYTPQARGILFGYFPSADKKRTIFTCLSHEIVAHETTHALLDGLRERYMDPSSPQQAGFHEGFADIVALLSIFSTQPVLSKMLEIMFPDLNGSISRKKLSRDELKKSHLFHIGQEMGSEISGVRGDALRKSLNLEPNEHYLDSGEYNEEHDCGEILVAAVLNAFLAVWLERLQHIGAEKLDRRRAAEEGSEIAERLLTMCIRAIDYCPPTDLQFGDFASAILTADWEINPRDEKYKMRQNLLAWFRKYGIHPSSPGSSGRPEGTWDPPPPENNLQYDRTHFEAMQSDHDELFRFIWENRKQFKLNPQAYTKVLSVRPAIRTGFDGFVLRETVVEYHQQLKIFASELDQYRVQKPKDMPAATEVTLYGGNAVIFDEYGHVKYNIGNSIMDLSNPKVQERQSKRLEFLWKSGAFDKGAAAKRTVSRIHAARGTAWYHSLR